MGVHEVAQRGFGSDADTYERVRPGYPDEVVLWFVEHLGLGPGAVVADVAAGTGKLTRELVETGAEVVAVEPVVAMRDVLQREVPDVVSVAATAEELPFADGTVDAVTVAQAFHWFDPEAAPIELARVLRPRARLGLVWNSRADDVDWEDALWAITDQVEKHAPWSGDEEWRDRLDAGLPGFGPARTMEYPHVVALTPTDIVARVGSVSHVAALPDDERAAVLDEVTDLLATHRDTKGREVIDVTYRAVASWCERA